MVLLWEVKSLFDLSIEAIVEGIVDQYCKAPSTAETSSQDQESDGSSGNEKSTQQQEYSPPPEKKRKLNQPLELKSNGTVETVRAEIDKYLVSSYSQVRQTLVERFFTKYYTGIQDADFNHRLYLHCFWIMSWITHSKLVVFLGSLLKEPMMELFAATEC